MPSKPTLKGRLRYWALMILTALGVGSYQAAQWLGCQSGMIDNMQTIPADPRAPEGKRVPNPNLGQCVEL